MTLGPIRFADFQCERAKLIVQEEFIFDAVLQKDHISRLVFP